jgi:tRNA nucleotidyltransferase (CCA-adding enzyme)
VAKTAAEGFETFLHRITPTASERAKAATHRAGIEAKLDAKFGLYRMFESGSFRHGTGVSSYSDVDLFASLKSAKPVYGSSALAAVRDALKERFPSTYIHVARPAVVLDFWQRV